MVLSADDRLKLNDMLSSTGAEDFTQQIREKKHSIPLKEDLSKIELGKGDECLFMQERYPDMHRKLCNGEMSIEIFKTMVDVLASIENGEIDQHEASVKIGTVLRELYIDSANRRTGEDERPDTRRGPVRDIGYSAFLKTKR